MGTITTGTGLISGLDSKSIIDQLIALEGKQKDLVQDKVDKANAQKTAFTSLQMGLTGLNITAQSIAKPSFFQNATATSSDEDVLTATAAPGAAVGSYQFRVARLVQSEQLVSNSFGDPAKSLVGAGKLTVELGGGQLTRQNYLADLRGGEGISRGQFRVTDRAGHTTVIDLGDAVTLDDVVKKFNTNVDISVKASVVNGKLNLVDNTGATTGNLIIADLADGKSAAQLGIAGTNTTGTVTGGTLAYVGRETSLSSLNDGTGVGNPPRSDFRIQLKNNTHVDIDLRDATTLGDVIDQINNQTNGKVTADLNATKTGIKIVDNTFGGGTFRTEPLNGTTTAADLGLGATASGNMIDGDPVVGAVGTVLLKSLNGGAGLTLGTLDIQGRNGSDTSIDLSGAKTVQDVLDTINASGGGVQAALNASGNGLQLTDTSGGTGDLVISGTAADTLGFTGTFKTDAPIVNGANLQRKWASNSTTLANYNGGKGVSPGEFQITAADGTTQTIEVDAATDFTLGDVIAKINTAFKGKVVAGINAHGDGLALTDATGAAGTLTVKDLGSSTAANLNIVGKATGTVLDGTMEKTIDITATDTLQAVQKKITDLNWGITATLINDGSGQNSNRLSLNATNAGLAGQVTFDAGQTKLGMRTLVNAQDAAVFVGSGDAGEPLLITSSKNTVTNAVKGVTLNLTSVSSDPVTLSVTNDVSNVTEALKGFVDSYNTLVDKLETYTSFRVDNDTSDDGAVKDENGNPVDPNAGTRTETTSDGTTYRKGILLGDYSVSQIQDQLSAMIQTIVPQGGKYRILSSIGIGTDDAGKLTFDEDKFNQAYADDPQGVKNLFTSTGAAINNDTQLRYLNGGDGVRTAGDGKDDFKAKLKDGTTVNVSIGEVTKVGDILNSINAAGKGKLLAEVDSNYKLVITDLTTGTGASSITQMNNSQFMFDVALTTTADTSGKFSSRKMVSTDPLATATGGIGVHFQKTINELINPVDGLIANESKTLDGKITQFQNRITDLNDMLDQKRRRLENQFNNLESVLAKLKTQQSSLGSIGSAAA
jgi:flagellar capping protein FliD